MSREHDKRLRNSSAEKPPPEGFSGLGEAMPDAEGESLDLRAGQHKQELVRSPRVAPLSVNETMSRYKKSQAQKFSEHTPEAQETRNAEAASVNAQTNDASQPNPFPQGSDAFFDEPVSFGESKRKRGKKPKKADKAKVDSTAPLNVEHQPPKGRLFGANTVAVENLLSVEEHPEAESKPSERIFMEKDSPLSHERPSSFQQERSRLGHNRSPIVPAISATPKRRKSDYYKGNPPAPTNENQTSQNATFENSQQTSRLVHENAANPDSISVSDSVKTPDIQIDNLQDIGAGSDATSNDSDVSASPPTFVIGEEHRTLKPPTGSKEDSTFNDNSGENSDKQTSANSSGNDNGSSKTVPANGKLKFEGDVSATPAKIPASPDSTKTGKKLKKSRA